MSLATTEHVSPDGTSVSRNLTT